MQFLALRFRKFRSTGTRSHPVRTIPRRATTCAQILGRSAGCALLVAAQLAWSADDPGARSLQQHQLQRQQQQEALQLRMQQRQRSAQDPSTDARRKRAIEQLQINQQQQQEHLHYRQQIAPPAAQPSDDEGTRRAKAEMERLMAQQQSQQQARQSERELQQGSGK